MTELISRLVNLGYDKGEAEALYHMYESAQNLDSLCEVVAAKEHARQTLINGGE